MSGSYTDHLKRFRERRNEREKLFALFERLEIKGLENARNCLCIGAGPGEFDLELIKLKVPNIKHIVAVDIDADGLKQFERNAIDKLSSAVRCETVLCPIQDWKFEDYKFDIILAFHIINDVKSDVRMMIFDQSFNAWLKSDGFFIFNNMTVDEVPGKPTITILFQKYCGPIYQDSKKDIEELGGEIILSEKYTVDWDFREYDTDLLPMFRFYNEKLTEKELKDMLNLLPNGTGAYILEMCVARKRNV